MKRPHVVCIPWPEQGHVNPMMQLAKLLHSRGIFITFVLTSFNQKRYLTQDSLDCLEGFRFQVIPDGLSPSIRDGMEDQKTFCESIKGNCVAPFRDLLRKLHQPSDGHRVTCVIADTFMTYPLKVAEEMSIPKVVLSATAACNLMSAAQYHELLRKALAQRKDESYDSNDYLDTSFDWIPGMRGIRLRDLGSSLQTTNPDDFILNSASNEAQNALKASMIIFNTYDDLEHEVLHAFQSMFPPSIYSIGPLLLQCRLLSNNVSNSVKLSLWKEETKCLKWLDSHKSSSVIYVNFGSTTTTTSQQLIEFAWAIADSKYPFLWVIRPDLVRGGHTNLPQEFMDETEGRGMLVSWSPQDQVLAHPSIAFFLTHSGWNSTLESIAFGVPMLCWPFFADQQLNCRYACNEWGVGMEIGHDAKREEIGVLIKQVMEGENGKEMRKMALKWKESAEIATKEGGSSHSNLELLIHKLLQLNVTGGTPNHSYRVYNLISSYSSSQFTPNQALCNVSLDLDSEDLIVWKAHCNTPSLLNFDLEFIN